jgi:carboxypeptidase C (cathepsin A)
VFVASGYYDLATPYFATQHTFHHLGLDASLESNVRIHHYDAGHMMYIHQPSLAQLKADLAAFYTRRQARDAADRRLATRPRAAAAGQGGA